jgi:hypothetical protein
MRRHRPGIGAVTQCERRGFTYQEQEIALAECKLAQYRVQLGQCIWCCRPMDIREGRWISARGATATLTEWSKAMTKQFNADSNCPALSHRSPGEIRAEYADGNRGHELACRGCAQRFHNTLYGENGAGAAYRRRFARLVNERGLTEEQQADPDTVLALHQDVISHLSQTRAARLAEAIGNATPAETEGLRKGGKKKKKTWPGRLGGKSKRTRLIGTGPEADAALVAEREHVAARPESALERMTRELLEGVKQ